jgi:hypothetical protein
MTTGTLAERELESSDEATNLNGRTVTSTIATTNLLAV